MSTSCTVCVRGYPTDLPPERVADKLMIHFLRARNGGGEIVNIEFAPEFPDYAMITFEDATVVQQVLKAKKHVLSVSGKNYPLEVTANATELNPNEIFVRVYMKINYGCFPNGKNILCSLHKQYEDIHFNFNSQELTCSVKGSFTELQAFSSELLRCLRSKQSTSFIANRGSSARDGTSHQEEEEEEGPVRNSVESQLEPLGDFSLVVDSDIYLYMQKFCSEEFSNILHQHQVDVMDVSSDDITTLYLRAASAEAGGVNALLSAHLALSQLSQQLEGTLRKEKISKGDLGVGGGRGLPGELQRCYPLLLCHEDDGHFYLIGNMVDVSQAKEYVQDFITAKRKVQDHQETEVPQSAYLQTLIHGQSALPAQLESPAKYASRKLSALRSHSKTEHRLAAKFNSKAFFNQDISLIGKLPGGLFQKVDHLTPDSELQVLAAATELESQDRQPTEFQKAPQGMQADFPLASSDTTVPGSEGQRNFDLKRPSASSTFRSLNLFDTTGAVDHKVSEPRSLHRRSSSFLLHKPQNCSETVDEPLLVAKVNVDHLQQEGQEEIHHTVQKEISKEVFAQMEKGWDVESQNNKESLLSSGLFTVQTDDRVPSDMQKAEALMMSPDYINESFSYSELAMEGPEDEALTDLCNYLKVCHDHIIVRRNRYRLGLAYPCKVKLEVLKVFHFFSAQRGTSLPERLLSHDMQQGKVQDEMSSTKIQRRPPLRKGSSRAYLSDSSLCLDSLAGENSSSPVQRLLNVSGFQPAMVQDLPSDRKAEQSKNFEKTTDTSKHLQPWKPLAEVRRGLPDRFHFVRDCGKEGCSHEAERGPCSLPALPLDISAPVQLQAAGKRFSPAGGGAASDLDGRAPSPRREPTAGESGLCRSTPAATSMHAPCSHTLCRTRFSTRSISPPYGCTSPVIAGTFAAVTLSQSLPGYFRDLTLKLTYDIPDGVQQAGHPRPGLPYRGDRFEAFLPDNPEGQRLMVLLHKAFERGLIFQIRSCGSGEKVTWGSIPHKTSMEGGKDRNGYPDAQYLRRISLMLKELSIE
ncbi:uncharacterized protein LOC134402732 [Elgaria multicarinata webbii]|uniref:uncharacterized protein LOC134402732 n=1 Tax=Elgaria multicarinata webbii TaxID=159646 RepID=UPI002FCCBE30